MKINQSLNQNQKTLRHKSTVAIFTPINFKHYGKKQKLLIPFSIQFTLANSNQNRFLLDFFHTFTVILRAVTRSNFCFPLDHLYIILPSTTRTMFKGVTSRKKQQQCTEVQNIEKTNQEKKIKTRILGVNSSFFTFLSLCPVQMQCPSQYINQALVLNSFLKILIYVSCCP